MSTNDVPGAIEHHKDELAMGCWAEHEDSSLIFVQSTEGGRVIYQMFDLTEDPIVEYRDAMPQKGFKEYFSFGGDSGEKWTWHDKTPFPWDRVIKAGAKHGQHFASAHDQISAAKRVADSLDKKRKKKKGKKAKKIKKRKIKQEEFHHMIPVEVKGSLRDRIIDRVQGAIDKLRA